jgi:hypothetical protein
MDATQSGPLVYVYTDTRWQVVKIVPALKLGQIDKFLILTARRGGLFKRVDDVNAERTHHAFISGNEHESARRGINAVVEASLLDGPLVGLKVWKTEIVRELTDAPQDATIVFNYLSGPTDWRTSPMPTTSMLPFSRTTNFMWWSARRTSATSIARLGRNGSTAPVPRRRR